MIECLLTNEEEFNSINEALNEYYLLGENNNFLSNTLSLNFLNQYLLGTLTVIPSFILSSSFSLRAIPSHFFQGLSQLTRVNAENCTTIGEQGFKDCINLKDIKLHYSTLSNEAFANCINLQTFSCGCAFNGEYIFSGCCNLFNLYLTNVVICPLPNINIFKNTPFDIDYISENNISMGSIYIPISLMNQYRTATNWTQLYVYNSQVFQPLPI